MRLNFDQIIGLLEKMEQGGQAPRVSSALKRTRKGKARSLTAGEIELIKSVFGDAIKTDIVMIMNKKYFIFQSNSIVMAPNGKIYYPKELFSEDFSQERLDYQATFIHEMVHIWQHQQGENVKLRGIFERTYEYELEPGKKFSEYGLEQQGNIVRDYFYLLNRAWYPNKPRPDIAIYRSLLPFTIKE